MASSNAISGAYQGLLKPISEYLKFTNMVKLFVGLSRTLFFVHEGLICDRIDYFRAAFKGRFKEGEEKLIELSEDDPVTIRETHQLDAEEQCVKACKACYAEFYEIYEDEVSYIYDNTHETSSLRACVNNSIVSYFCQGTLDDDDPSRRFSSWDEFQGAYDMVPRKYKKEWMAAIKDHLTTVTLDACDISCCLYHSRSNSDFVLED